MRKRRISPAVRLVLIIASLAILLVFTGCGGGSSTPITQQPLAPPAAPTITSLSPRTIVTGGPAFTLTVNGTNFVSNSTVLWNGAARPTTFISSTQLQAAITAADAVNAGSVNVAVSNPGSGGTVAISTNFAFTITRPSPPVAPVITLLTPGTITAGGSAFTLTVDGVNFFFMSSVLWNGSARPTTMVSNTRLHAFIAAADIVSSSTANIEVSTPASGGTTVKSADFGFTVMPPLLGVPTISSLNPAGA